MLELIINGRKSMQINDDNKTIIFDNNLASTVNSDIEGRKIDFELQDEDEE